MSFIETSAQSLYASIAQGDTSLTPYQNLRTCSSASDGFVVESPLVITRALQSNWLVHSIVGTRPRLKKLSPYLLPQTRIYIATPEELNNLVGFRLHRGCAAHVQVPSRMLKRQRTISFSPLKRVVVAETIADPANIGSLIRNCRAFGVDLLILDPKGGSPFCRKAARSSAGLLFHQELCLASPIEILKHVVIHSGVQV